MGVDILRALPLQLRCRTIAKSIVALARLCKHPPSLLRSQAHYESFNLQPLKRSKTNTSSSIFLLLRWVDKLRALPLQLRCRTIDTSIVALVQLCKHPHSLLRSQAHYESFNLQPLNRSKTNKSSSIFLLFFGEVDRPRASPFAIKSTTANTVSNITCLRQISLPKAI